LGGAGVGVFRPVCKPGAAQPVAEHRSDLAVGDREFGVASILAGVGMLHAMYDN